jgi:hypothetical protein
VQAEKDDEEDAYEMSRDEMAGGSTDMDSDVVSVTDEELDSDHGDEVDPKTGFAVKNKKGRKVIDEEVEADPVWDVALDRRQARYQMVIDRAVSSVIGEDLWATKAKRV